MSWDVVLFNSAEKIGDLDNLDVNELAPVHFGQAFERHFQVKKDDDAWDIKGADFSIVYYDDGPVTNCMVNLYGENAIYAIAHLAKMNGWQVFDTGLGEMLDLDDPSKNGYNNFQSYLKHVSGK